MKTFREIIDQLPIDPGLIEAIENSDPTHPSIASADFDVLDLLIQIREAIESGAQSPAFDNLICELRRALT